MRLFDKDTYPRTEIMSGGMPSASCQQWASERAEYPRRHCFSGSARNCFQSSGEEVGIRIFATAWLLLGDGLGYSSAYGLSGLGPLTSNGLAQSC